MAETHLASGARIWLWACSAPNLVPFTSIVTAWTSVCYKQVDHYRDSDWALNPPIIDGHYSDFILKRQNHSVTVTYLESLLVQILDKHERDVFLELS